MRVSFGKTKNKDSGKFIALLLIHLILVPLDYIRSLPKFLSVFDFFAGALFDA